MRLKDFTEFHGDNEQQDYIRRMREELFGSALTSRSLSARPNTPVDHVASGKQRPRTALPRFTSKKEVRSPLPRPLLLSNILPGVTFGRRADDV